MAKVTEMSAGNREIELIIRKSTLKDVELWLAQQYDEINKELLKLQEAKQ